MPVYQLGPDNVFPPAEHSNEEGVLAVGGDLSIDRLKLAYSQGIFPWYSDDLPIIWHSPDPRMVLLPADLKVNRSLKKAIKKEPYRLSMDTAFSQVIRECSVIPRPGQDGTWITNDMIDAYIKLHEAGFAHSVEAWDGPNLVGGLYGVSIGSAFFGESMFSKVDNASKIAFATFVEQLSIWNFKMVDCQVHTDHLEKFGATEWPRSKFLTALKSTNKSHTKTGLWSFKQDE